MTIYSPPARQPKDDTQTALLMAAPALVGLLLFVALPFLLAVILSFTNLRLGSPLPIEFLGFEQYRRVWLDPNFRQALLNNGLFALVMVPVQTAIALGLALLLNRPLQASHSFARSSLCLWFFRWLWWQ